MNDPSSSPFSSPTPRAASPAPAPAPAPSPAPAPTPGPITRVPSPNWPTFPATFLGVGSTSDNSACYWNITIDGNGLTSTRTVLTSGTWQYAWAVAVAADAKRIIGAVDSDARPDDSIVYWDNGVITDTGILNDALAVSADGTRVITNYTVINFPGGEGPDLGMRLTSISADGQTLAAVDDPLNPNFGGTHATNPRLIRNGVVTNLAVPDGYSAQLVTSVSDGPYPYACGWVAQIGANDVFLHAQYLRWRPDGGYDVVIEDTDRGWMPTISRDGSTVMGRYGSQYTTFRWNENTGFAQLTSDQHFVPDAVSQDCDAMVGFDGTFAPGGLLWYNGTIYPVADAGVSDRMVGLVRVA